jgi:predicted exporter
MPALRLHYVLVGLPMILLGAGLLVFCAVTQHWGWGTVLSNLPPVAGGIGTIFLGYDLISYSFVHDPA